MVQAQLPLVLVGTTDTGPAANQSYWFPLCILSLSPEIGNAPLTAFYARLKICLTAKFLGHLAPSVKGLDVLKTRVLMPVAPEVLHAGVS